MVISHMNNKGFLLLDSLVNVLVICVLCLLCFSIYKAIDNYDDGYKEYVEKSNEEYDYFYNSLGECEKCIIVEETDLSKQELY